MNRGSIELIRGLLGGLLAAGLVLGCSTKDPEKCDRALTVARQAAAGADFTAAGAWRDYAYRQCEDRAALEAMDRDITARQAEVAAQQAAKRERRNQTRELLKVFLGFVAGHRNSPDQASSAPSCDPLPSDSAKKGESTERFCVATRSAGTHPMLARYWGAKPPVARFSVKLPDSTSCEEIGASRVVKSWPVAAVGGKTTGRSRCEFVSGPLTGMHAVLSQAVNADLYIFHPEYLDYEPSMKLVLEGP